MLYRLHIMRMAYLNGGKCFGILYQNEFSAFQKAPHKLAARHPFFQIKNIEKGTIFHVSNLLINYIMKHFFMSEEYAPAFVPLPN